jgi:hypothetical protein
MKNQNQAKRDLLHINYFLQNFMPDLHKLKHHNIFSQ